MSDVKISQLPAATTPVAGTEVLPIVQASETRKVSISNLTAGRPINATEIILGTTYTTTIKPSGSLASSWNFTLPVTAGTNGYVLKTDGTGVSSWVAPSSFAVTTFNGGTTGLLPSTPTAGAVTLSGTLGVVNGGTGLSSTTANQILYSSSSNVIAGLSTANTAALVTNSSGVPSLTSGGTANRVLRTNGTTVSFSQVALSTDVSGTLPLANGGTNANLTASNGGIFYSTATAGAILSGTATAGQMLQSGASSAPSWSTATFPATATTTGTILRADGTNWTATTATYPATTTINQILYSSAANTVAGLATANTSALVTNSSGVPSLTSGTTANRVLRTDGTTVSFAQVALATDVSGTLPVANFPVGSIIQVVGASYATATSSTSTSYATSGLTASITPISSSNKILVLMNISNIQTNDAGNGCNLQIWRGGSNLIQTGVVTGYLSGTSPSYVLISGGFSASYLDSPATTSSTTYAVYFASNTAGQTVSIHVNNSTSTLVLLEVVA